MSVPRVYVVARTCFDVGQFVQFLSSEQESWSQTSGATDAERLIEAAGRICYMSFGQKQSPRTNREYLANLIRMGHESVLEHVSWTMVLAGISRALSHQLVRHRVGIAFSQLSQQYHDESEASFVMPTQLRESPVALAEWTKAMEVVKTTYKSIANCMEPNVEGLSDDERREKRRAWRSVARSVLPNATETKLIMTANARALRHLLCVRGGIAGDIEMRTVMVRILELVSAEAPALFPDFRIETLPDGTRTVVQDPIRD